MIRANATTWTSVLARERVADRPRPDVWSPLEYSCHVRDVFRTYDARVALMLGRDDPTFPDWDQDATAVDDEYGLQDPAVVAVDLVDAAERLASRFDVVAPDQWDRTGTRSDGSRFTVESLARYMIHDPVHHLHDVGA